jgi:hypothetical protein
VTLIARRCTRRIGEGYQASKLVLCTSFFSTIILAKPVLTCSLATSLPMIEL